MATFIKQISEINAVSGNEGNIREFILDHIHADNIEVDNMGNIIALKKGKNSSKKIMVATHMDESGFIVSNVTDSGYIKFKPVGNIDINTVISKKVNIGNTKGVIGMKAIHLQTKEERENTVPAKNLFIDIGAKSKKDALESVKMGDYICLDTEFKETKEYAFGKALSRLGIDVLISSMDISADCDIYYVFTVQKEVGMRGAKILARLYDVDTILTVDTVCADDVFNNDSKTISLGEGIVIPAMDKYSIYDSELIKKLEKVKHQKAVTKNEFSDAGAFSAKRVNISIPCRYAKTPVEMIAKSDLETAKAAIKELISDISGE